MLTIFLAFVVALGVSFQASSWAEVDRSNPAKQEADVDSKKSPKQVQRRRPVGLVPFPQYEEKMRNSEKWKEMSPQEQEEALAKIQRFREIFTKNQVERQRAYNSILKKKQRKPRKMPQDDEEPLQEKPLEGVR